MVQAIKDARWVEILSVTTSAASILVFLFVFGVWKGRVDAHIEDESVHYTEKTLGVSFVPREEHGKDVEAIKEVKTDVKALSDKVDHKFDELYKFIRENK